MLSLQAYKKIRSRTGSHAEDILFSRSTVQASDAQQLDVSPRTIFHVYRFI